MRIKSSVQSGNGFEVEEEPKGQVQIQIESEAINRVMNSLPADAQQMLMAAHVASPQQQPKQTEPQQQQSQQSQPRSPQTKLNAPPTGY